MDGEYACESTRGGSSSRVKDAEIVPVSEPKRPYNDTVLPGELWDEFLLTCLEYQGRSYR